MDDTTTTNTTATHQPAIFNPQAFVPPVVSHDDNHHNNTNNNNHMMMMNGEEAPLLEELGINLQHIWAKMQAVVVPTRKTSTTLLQPSDICQDADLAGPIALCLILGAEMVLTGRFQFGYIYGFGVFGCISMTLIVNLMVVTTSNNTGISIWTVSSVLGYALLPVNVLAAIKLIGMNSMLFFQLPPTLGRILGLLTVAWSTIASTRLLELGCGLREQRYLIAYPIALLYSAFVMITIF